MKLFFSFFSVMPHSAVRVLGEDDARLLVSPELLPVGLLVAFLPPIAAAVPAAGAERCHERAVPPPLRMLLLLPLLWVLRLVRCGSTHPRHRGARGPRLHGVVVLRLVVLVLTLEVAKPVG